MRPGGTGRLPGILLALALVALAGPARSSADDIATVAPPGLPEVKCGCFTCGNPCNTQPPPLPSPPPPPPSPPPPPPPPPKGPFLPFCPPPPFHVLGPPGNLYPLDPGYLSAAGRHTVVALPALLGCGLAGILGFWLL